jgi:hypothetical protein
MAIDGAGGHARIQRIRGNSGSRCQSRRGGCERQREVHPISRAIRDRAVLARLTRDDGHAGQHHRRRSCHTYGCAAAAFPKTVAAVTCGGLGWSGVSLNRRRVTLTSSDGRMCGFAVASVQVRRHTGLLRLRRRCSARRRGRMSTAMRAAMLRAHAENAACDTKHGKPEQKDGGRSPTEQRRAHLRTLLHRCAAENGPAQYRRWGEAWRPLAPPHPNATRSAIAIRSGSAPAGSVTPPSGAGTRSTIVRSTGSGRSAAP